MWIWEHERERDQTHSYWYIPSAPRVNYSLLVMESAGMMKIATGEGSPLRQGAGTGSWLAFSGYRGFWRRTPERFLVATEACGTGTPDLSWYLMFLGYVGLYRRKKSVGRCSSGPRDRGRALHWGRPPISWSPRVSSDLNSTSPGWYSSKKSRCRRFHSVWTPFDIPFLRNTETGNKTAIWAGPPVNRLVPKII